MISSAQLGDRIASARKRHSLTQAALAEKLGIARTTIVAMEKGERRPTNRELVLLAEALSVTLNDLLREHVVIAQVSPRFRSAPKEVDGKIDEVVAELKALAEQYAELEQNLGVARTPAPLEAVTSFRSVSLGHGASPRVAGEDAAGFLRRLLGLGDGPASSLQSRLELEAGLRVFSLKMPATVSAVMIWSDQVGACVALNRDHPRERRRWSLVHELGHFLRDREAGDVLPYSLDRRDPSEVFCEALAAEFLMPAAGVRRRFAEHLRDRGEKQFSAADLLALARFYEVSLQGMTLRLEHLELLPEGTYDRLRKRNFKSRQAADLLGLTGARENGPDMFPQRYLRLAFEAFAQSVISEGELARFLHTDRIHARRKYLDWTTQVEDDGKMEVDLREPVVAEASQE